MPGSDYNAVEPMQVDLPPEENENIEEENFTVDNPTIVSLLKFYYFLLFHSFCCKF
jgi:hypothetical protein